MLKMVCASGAALKAPGALRTSFLYSSSKRACLFVKERQSASFIIIFKRNHETQAMLDISKPYGYYDVLGLKISAKQSDVKQAYIKLAKVYHPDVNKSENARENFDKITEAYTTLMDMTERYFYDQHGHPAGFLKKKGSETIFDWTPKYGIYEESADARKREVEDWFDAQGHSTTQSKITLRQRLKNAFVEVKFGFNYFNFPWNWDIFFLSVAGWAVFLFLFREAFVVLIQSVSWNPPKQGENRDILWYTGLRRNNVSSQSSEASGFYHGFYQNPKPGMIPYIKSAQVVAHAQETTITEEKPAPVKLTNKEANERRIERLKQWEEDRESIITKKKPAPVKLSSKEANERRIERLKQWEEDRESTITKKKPAPVKLSSKEANERRIERLKHWEEERHLKRMEEINKMEVAVVSKQKRSSKKKVEKGRNTKLKSKLQKKKLPPSESKKSS